MLGIIGFKQHRIRCLIGNNEAERQHEQEIFVDLKIKIDFSRCAESDDLRDSVCYLFLSEFCTQLAQQNRYRLLEAFASDAIEQLLALPPIQWVWIRIMKPQALPSAEYALIELESSK